MKRSKGMRDEERGNQTKPNAGTERTSGFAMEGTFLAQQAETMAHLSQRRLRQTGSCKLYRRGLFGVVDMRRAPRRKLFVVAISTRKKKKNRPGGVVRSPLTSPRRQRRYCSFAFRRKRNRVPMEEHPHDSRAAVCNNDAQAGRLMSFGDS